MSNFTPGPWEAVKDNDFYGYSIVTKDNKVKVVASFIDSANARLIAAAPEMLEVIHDLLEPAYERYQYVLETDTPDEAEVYKETIDQAEALLRRIEGEEDPA